MPDSTWQALYRAALAEPDLNKLDDRIEAARHAIHKRLQQIVLADSGDTREREQLENALRALFTLPTRRRVA